MGPVARQVDDHQAIQSILCCAYTTTIIVIFIIDAYGSVKDAEISSLFIEGRSETHTLFSQKNLLRLAALNDSQRTLSLFVPSTRAAVFQAWAGHSERSARSGSSGNLSLLRSHSYHGNTRTTYNFSDIGPKAASYHLGRYW
jgi:hypothetical protein